MEAGAASAESARASGSTRLVRRRGTLPFEDGHGEEAAPSRRRRWLTPTTTLRQDVRERSVPEAASMGARPAPVLSATRRAAALGVGEREGVAVALALPVCEGLGLRERLCVPDALGTGSVLLLALALLLALGLREGLADGHMAAGTIASSPAGEPERHAKPAATSADCGSPPMKPGQYSAAAEHLPAATGLPNAPTQRRDPGAQIVALQGAHAALARDTTAPPKHASLRSRRMTAERLPHGENASPQGDTGRRAYTSSRTALALAHAHTKPSVAFDEFVGAAHVPTASREPRSNTAQAVKLLVAV